MRLPRAIPGIRFPNRQTYVFSRAFPALSWHASDRWHPPVRRVEPAGRRVDALAAALRIITTDAAASIYDPLRVVKEVLEMYVLCLVLARGNTPGGRTHLPAEVRPSARDRSR